jgi:hypothetical protein
MPRQGIGMPGYSAINQESKGDYAKREYGIESLSAHVREREGRKEIRRRPSV